ncbi:MAG: sugar ABC transporter substrate-binding protein [Kutzneria sp.]|nr:sugar ABC transporter substrate-binding protein [Kutzneria sp.]MBV9845960.1 sugar ABC transporter substrate-binding protein [Kutzneria sp.]
MLSKSTKKFLSSLLGVASVVLLTACAGPSAPGPDRPDTNLPNGTAISGTPMHVAVITHGSAGDVFWNVVKNGAMDAGKQLGVTVDYSSDEDAQKQAGLIESAVARKVDGLVVSMANPDALKNAVQNAVKAGIPVVTINSGQSRSVAFGAIGHVGQDETIAGRQAGEKLKSAGRTKLLCVIHENGNVGLDQRCDGARQGFGQVTTLKVDINNPTDVETSIKNALQGDPTIDAVLTLNPQVALSAANAVKDVNPKVVVSTFDLSSDVVAAIRSGQVLFAVDQQQYEQGYLPIVLLRLYHDNANTIGGGQPTLTGPGFVDKSNVDKVAQYAARGTR